MRIPFSFRLITSVVIIEVIMLVILVWNNNRLTSQSYSELLETSFRSQSELLAAAVAPGLVAYDHALVEDALSQIKEKHDLIYALVVDIQGNKIASIGSSTNLSMPVFHNEYYESLEHNQLLIKRTIKVAGQSVGALHMKFSTERLSNHVDNIRTQNMAISLFTLLILVIATVIISIAITRKLSLLRHGVEQIQNGNLDNEINISSNDEIGDLADAFNDMTHHLTTTRNELIKEHNELERQATHLNTLLNSIDAVIWEADAKTRTLIFVSNEAVDLLGFSLEKWLEHRFLLNIVCQEDKEILIKGLDKLASGFHQISIDVRFRNASDQLIWTRIIASSELADKNHSHNIIIRGLILDITNEKRHEQQIIYLAEHDPLTGLINRREFQNRLTHHIAYGKRNGHDSCLLFIDLDQFKYINDTFGHVAGDAYLVQVADVLEHTIRDTDILGRLGGDEFGIILPFTNEEEASLVASNILSSLSEKNWQHQGSRVMIRASIGITRFPADGKTPSILLAEADTAMYVAKSLGRNRFHLYHEHDSETQRMQDKITVENLIHDALKNNNFKLHFQPIISFANDEVSHYEALVRIVKDNGEIIMPDQFIGTAERFGLITDIDHWTISTVITMLEQAIARNNVIDIAVNLSGNHLDDTNFHSWIHDILKKHPDASSHLIIEITETAAISNLLSANDFIASMLELGVRFAIDDFGVGFSSFHYIKNLPVHYIKIDGSFVRNLHNDEIDRVFVNATVEIARSLNIHTIAEYVENKEIANILKSMGADYGQGYHLGKPASDLFD